MTEGGYVARAAEVAAPSASIDLYAKLNVYRRHRVKEHAVWRVLEETSDWFVLHEGCCEPLSVEAGQPHRVASFLAFGSTPPR